MNVEFCNKEKISELAKMFGVNKVIYIDNFWKDIDGVKYFVYTYPSLECLFKRACGKDVYLKNSNVYRAFYV